MVKKLLFSLIAVISLSQTGIGQDLQYSQFYAAPLYLNPAFTGATGCGRAGLNYRNQWPSLQASFVTYSVYGDYFFEDYNSGAGLLINHDVIGSGLSSTSFGLSYAYQLRVTKALTFRAGAQGAFVLRNINYNRFTFGSQFNEDDFNFDRTLPSGEVFNDGRNINYFDLNLGGVLYGPNYWVGYAASHITGPNQSYENDRVPLPIKHSFHAGYKIQLYEARSKGFMPQKLERSVTPTVQYRMQDRFDQLDIGSYFTFEPVIFGIMYRGLPFKTYKDETDNESLPNNESLIALVGLDIGNLNIGYSFDYTISGLGIRSGGAHEVSLSYKFCLRDPRKPPKDVRKLPCPEF
jgi:type IX secretion system PorP/SprF family membrane protein